MSIRLADPEAKHSRLVTRLGGERGVGTLLPVLIAAFVLGLGIHINGRFLNLDAFGKDTMATIIERNTIFDNSARSLPPRYEMIVGFTVGDVMRRGSVPVTLTYFDAHGPGERVPIRYLPDDPQVREIDPARQAEFIREGVGLIALLLAIATYNFFTLKQARPANGSAQETGNDR